jgi:hypothetical protein
MKIVLLIVIIFTTQLGAQDIIPWQNIRNSAYTPDDSIHIRFESLGAEFSDTFVHFSTSTGWDSVATFGVYEFTQEAILSATPDETQTTLIKSISDEYISMMPKQTAPLFPPPLTELSFVSEDPVGDVMVPDRPHLDLTGYYWGYTEDTFNAVLSADAPGFPTDSGGIIPAEFYLYGMGIVNPENALQDSVFYAMIYANLSPFITPGLYRIMGEELSLDSFHRIGDISTDIQNHNLQLACSIDELVDDEYFGDWPNLSNSLLISAVTISFSLPDDVQIADFTIPSSQFFESYQIEPFENTLPELSDPSATSENGFLHIEVTYFDADEHFPTLAKATINRETYQMFPQSFDYSQPVQFSVTVPETDWENILISFSDNGYDFVEENIYNTNTDDEMLFPIQTLTSFPNPFNTETTIKFSLQETQHLKLNIYNSRGQLVNTLISDELTKGDHFVVWNGTDNNGETVSSGVYFCSLITKEQNKNIKLMLLK